MKHTKKALALKKSKAKAKSNKDGTKPAHKGGKKQNKPLHESHGGSVKVITDEDGNRYWYKNSTLHRDGDRPAVIKVDGTKEWYKNGQRHRDGNEPAVIKADGTKLWYRHGRRHDGPLHESNLFGFITQIVQKNYSKADKYLQREIDQRLKSQIKKNLQNHE